MCIVPNAVMYRMLSKALWESVRAQGLAQKNAQAGIQASVGFQVSISEVPGGNLFFFSPCLPPPLYLPGTSPPSTNSCFPLRQGSLSLIVNQTNSRFRPTVHAGICPSLNHYNSSNTYTYIWLDRRSIRSNRRYREYRRRSHAFVDNGNSTSSRISPASRACSRVCIPSDQ